jgi:4-hydroxyphenylpyruvate dioxygenase
VDVRFTDVAFEVDSVDAVFNAAVERGAVVVSKPAIRKDVHGWVKVATVKTYGETTHTLVERKHYSGTFLPGYRSESGKDPLSTYLPRVGLKTVDHCVGNQDWGEMDDICD